MQIVDQFCETQLNVLERVRIGIDIGGTFTDIVAVRGGSIIAVRKLPSTPDDYSRAIRDGLHALVQRGSFAPDEVEAVVHGTTVATNAILEGQGARTGLITTKGFRDVLELRRIRIPELYNFGYDKPPPLVPRRYRHEITERIAADGSVLVPLDESELEAALHRLREQGVKSLAICFLNSYVAPDHERRAAERARAVLEDVFVTASCEILPEIREYERTSTTVLNAYVGPRVRIYLHRIVDVLRDFGILAPLRIMQSSGGTLDLDAVLQVPAAIVESGPAAGVVAGALLARHQSSSNAITIDMGGTTAKAALIENGKISKTTEYEVGAGINLSSQLVKGRGHALKLPVVDISEIGAGGGSLAVVDRSGRVRVGPESAGSVPGPVAYARGGTTATLTDALVVMGYINATAVAGGTVSIDGMAARAALQTQIAERLGTDIHRAAHGVYLIAAALMTRAVKAVTTFRGRDPRDCILVAFGGNGALMAPLIADDLQVGTILIPPIPGLFSACGLVIAPNERERVRTVFRRLSAVSRDDILRHVADLTTEATRDLLADGATEAGAVVCESTAELRYAGQAYELGVSVPPNAVTGDLLSVLAEEFHTEHERTFGHASRGEPIDLVNIRVVARETRAIADLPRYCPQPQDNSGPHRRELYFGPEIGMLETPILSRADLGTRGETAGPLVLEEYDATVVIPPGWRARLETGGSLLVRRL